jgi:hypothetical protein
MIPDNENSQLTFHRVNKSTSGSGIARANCTSVALLLKIVLHDKGCSTTPALVMEFVVTNGCARRSRADERPEEISLHRE